MKKLYILRHANAAESPPVKMGDHERVLSPEGERAAEELGAFMKAHGMMPDFVLSSSSVRTIQTVRIVFGHLFTDEGQKIRTLFDRALYLAPAKILLQHVMMMDDSVGSLLLVAHNPGIFELAAALGPVTDFPPAALAVFSIDAESWSGLSHDNVRLDDFFVPPGV